MSDDYDRQGDFARRALRKNDDPPKSQSPSKQDNSKPSEANSEAMVLSLIGAFIVGAVIGLLTCGSVWLIADFSEYYGNFSVMVGAIIGPLVGGIFGIIIELIRQKRI